MDKQRFFRRKLVAALAAVFGAAGTAMAVGEVEPNGSIATAQRLEAVADGSGKGSATVTGMVGTTSGTAVQDVDFYSFYAGAGDVVTLNIDSAAGGSLDTHIYLFGPDQTELGYNDDDASGGTLDSRIDIQIPQAGIYTVAVTGYGVFLGAGGIPLSTSVPPPGDYALIVSGVSLAPAPEPGPLPSPLVQEINIAFKPDERKALMHAERRGHIAVMLMSSRTFNAHDVDVASVTFGPTGTEASPKKCNWHGERANHDRRGRMMCLFDANAVGFRADDVEGVLRGTTRDGKAFEGRRELKVAHKKKEKDRDHHHGEKEKDRHGDRDERRGKVGRRD